MFYSKWVCIFAAVIYICKSSDAELSYNKTIYQEEINSAENYDNSPPELKYSKSQHDRKSKFLFSIIQRFTTEICRTTNEKRGLCQTKSQCAEGGGTAQGSCAQGIAVCCRYVVHCGGVVLKNGTSFQNPEYPSKYTEDGSNSCQIRIKKQMNVCQLRLNFDKFQIAGPVPPLKVDGKMNDAGTCKTDSLEIMASGGNIPSLCGNLTAQHIYVEFGSSDTVTLSLLFNGAGSYDRLWDIEIYMIPCNSPSRAPSGCLQWLTGISGKVMSFNFENQHFANMQYSVCIRHEDGMRFIDWTPCTPGAVQISGAAETETEPKACTSTGTGAKDYVIITGGISFPFTAKNPEIASSLTDRFCDSTWPKLSESAYVRSSARPFILQFKSDGTEIGGEKRDVDGHMGFCLKWKQSPQ